MVAGGPSSMLAFVFLSVVVSVMMEVMVEEDRYLDEELLYNTSIPVPMPIQPRHNSREDGNLDKELLYNTSIRVPMPIQPHHNSRIIGGKPTSIKRFPWQVRISVGCGGSILSTTWILSAAHCFAKGVPDIFSDNYTITVNRITIYAGLTRRSQINSDPDVQIRTIHGGELKDHLFVHKNYKKGALYNNDIALIKMKDPLSLGEKVQLIRLAHTSDFIPGKEAVASGWGKISDNKNIGSPDILQYVDGLKLISKDECKRHYGKYVTEKNICHLTRNKNVCNGDSGGPLITGIGRSNGPPFVQIGINSFVSGHGCEVHAPGVFVDVTLTEFQKWIADTMSGACSDKNEHCSYWTMKGYCRHTHVKYMKKNCPKSCNLCGDSCTDKERHCSYWKRKGYCRHTHVKYMRANCPKTCNIC